MLPIAVTPPAVHSYQVQSGDTLWGIAQKEYNNPNDWPAIYNANKGLIANPALILPHWNLTIPGDPDNQTYVPQHSAGYQPKHAAPSDPAFDSAYQLSPSQVGTLWIQSNGPAWAENEAECIAFNESGDVPTANNYYDNGGTQTSWGLFQISNGTHAEPVANIDNPEINTEQAVIKFRDEGDSFYPDWGTAGDC